MVVLVMQCCTRPLFPLLYWNIIVVSKAIPTTDEWTCPHLPLIPPPKLDHLMLALKKGKVGSFTTEKSKSHSFPQHLAPKPS